jgi:hypothetical protein
LASPRREEGIKRSLFLSLVDDKREGPRDKPVASSGQNVIALARMPSPGTPDADVKTHLALSLLVLLAALPALADAPVRLDDRVSPAYARVMPTYTLATGRRVPRGCRGADLAGGSRPAEAAALNPGAVAVENGGLGGNYLQEDTKVRPIPTRSIAASACTVSADAWQRKSHFAVTQAARQRTR